MIVIQRKEQVETKTQKFKISKITPEEYEKFRKRKEKEVDDEMKQSKEKEEKSDEITKIVTEKFKEVEEVNKLSSDGIIETKEKEIQSDDDDIIITKYHSKIHSETTNSLMKESIQHEIEEKQKYVKTVDRIPQVSETSEDVMMYVNQIKEWLNETHDCTTKSRNFFQNIKNGKKKNIIRSCATEISTNRWDDICIHPDYLQWFISYLKTFIKLNELNIHFIRSNTINKNDIREKVERKKEWEFILYTQFDGNDQNGHWLLNLIIKSLKTIVILNSLPEWKPKSYLLHDSFPEYECIELNSIPKQKGCDCGYWVMYYCFLIIRFKVPLHHLHTVLFMTSSEYFDKFKKFLLDFCKGIVNCAANRRQLMKMELM